MSNKAELGSHKLFRALQILLGLWKAISGARSA